MNGGMKQKGPETSNILYKVINEASSYISQERTLSISKRAREEASIYM